MAPEKNRITVRGSERAPLSGAQLLGPADPKQRIEVTVMLRRRSAPQAFPAVEEIGGLYPSERRTLTREEFAQAHGADPAHLNRIQAFAKESGLEVIAESSARRTVVLAGTVEAFQRAFGVQLQQFDHPSGRFRCRTGPIQVPAELEGIIEGVFGLDNRPQAKPHFRRQTEARGKRQRANSRSFAPTEIARLYSFPSGISGAGQTIGFIELGGGFRTADLDAYYRSLGLTGPQVRTQSVDGATNQPTGNLNGPDIEVALDLEVAGAASPGAGQVVYFAPNTDRGFLDAVSTAIHDATNKPTVLSISWGGPETTWTQQALTAMNELFREAAALGITVCCASGDDGSSDGVPSGEPTVDFPASSPFALSCGGTHLEAIGEQITSETVWNDEPQGGATGGGTSRFFALPTWQQKANVPPAPNQNNGRGVPDVAGDADPQTGYAILVHGRNEVVGGTSAVAPLWSALLARIDQVLGRTVGYLNPLLYGQLPNDVCRDITTGSNGAFSAGPGWDPCTGLGSPNGATLLAALRPTGRAARP